jgi:hypothetical protein
MGISEVNFSFFPFLFLFLPGLLASNEVEERRRMDSTDEDERGRAKSESRRNRVARLPAAACFRLLLPLFFAVVLGSNERVSWFLGLCNSMLSFLHRGIMKHVHAAFLSQLNLARLVTVIGLLRFFLGRKAGDID